MDPTREEIASVEQVHGLEGLLVLHSERSRLRAELVDILHAIEVGHGLHHAFDRARLDRVQQSASPGLAGFGEKNAPAQHLPVTEHRLEVLAIAVRAEAVIVDHLCDPFQKIMTLFVIIL
jgi:hypothetical protein